MTPDRPPIAPDPDAISDARARKPIWVRTTNRMTLPIRTYGVHQNRFGSIAVRPPAITAKAIRTKYVPRAARGSTWAISLT